MSSLLNIGTSALAAAQAQLATISHNIANVNTEGYSRQQAVQETAGALYTGSGFFGRGTDVTTVRRIFDSYLARSAQAASATSEADKARALGLESLDKLFANPDQGVGAAVDALFAAAGDLAARPSDLSARQTFLSRASQLAARIDGLGQQITQQQADADGRLQGDVAKVNLRVADIGRLNEKIALAQASGQPPNDLLDQRDAALQALNGLVEVHAVSQGDGTLNLFTANGSPLLVGNSASLLRTVPDPADGSRSALELVVSGQARPLDRAQLGGGSLAGTLALRDVDLPAALNAVGVIAVAVAKAFNDQHGLGVDMDGQVGAELFKLPDPQALPGQSNTGTLVLQPAIADPAALQGSDYDLGFDGSNYTITRLADNHKNTFASLPQTVDGVSFAPAPGAGTPAAGDSWRIKPQAAAATSLQVQRLSPRQVATGQAATVQSAVTNRGTVQASQFAMVRSDPANAGAVRIVFDSPPTTYTVTGLAGGTLSKVPYVSGQQVPPAPADYNGWRMTLSGVPAELDQFDIGPVANPGAANRNALAFAGIASQGLVRGFSVNQAYASLLADVGLRTQAAQDAAQVSGALAQDASARQQQASGVNLDEEAADLLRFQQAYQASAKIIQASQTLFESLLSATGR